MAGIAVGGELARLAGGAHVLERDHAPLLLRDRLLRHDDDVAVLEPPGVLRGRREQAGEVVALLHRRDARQRDHAELAHARYSGRPVRRMPACTLYALFTFSSTEVRPSSARALASGPASIARPATIRDPSSSTSRLASGSLAADQHVLVRRVAGRHVRGGERLEAGDDRPVHDVSDLLRQRAAEPARGHAARPRS